MFYPSGIRRVFFARLYVQGTCYRLNVIGFAEQGDVTMDNKHKLIIFARGTTFNCYLDMSRIEATKRYAELEKSKTDVQRATEAKLQVVEIEFNDEFEIWGNANEDVQNLVNTIFEREFGK
jgi:hypothetical protein